MTDSGRSLAIAEHALAHVIGDKAEQAYRRGDALETLRADGAGVGAPLRSARVMPAGRLSDAALI